MDIALQHLTKDPILKRIIQAVQLPETDASKDVYRGLIRSITSQQLSVKAAETIYLRFLNLFEDQYPHADQLLRLEDSQLRGAGLSGQKTRYVKNVADFFTEKDLFHKDWSDQTDEEIIALLTEIKGVGRWTVEMILMFVLDRGDVLPVLDLGIQQAIKELYGITSEKKALYADMEKVSLQWKPYRTLACRYLWCYKDAQ